MERAMGDLLLRECLVFVDEILVFSETFEEHIVRLENVFQRLSSHGLKLKGSKCEFFKTSVSYLGHVISENGISTDPEKTSAISSWPVPKNIAELRTFLGTAGFYRRFIKDYSKLAKTLNDLLEGHGNSPKSKSKRSRKTATWVWGDAQQSSFDILKEKLTSPPVLAFADFSKPFKVHIDSSGSGLGAVLLQEQDGKQNQDCDGLSRRPQLFSDAVKAVCFAASVSLSSAECCSGDEVPHMANEESLPSEAAVRPVDWAVAKVAELVPIKTSRPMQLVCMDFLKLEKSKGGYEDVLVITDHFTRYAKAIPCRNQKATTTARALYEHFIVHYSFPEQLHSDQGRNFGSRVIKELCKIANVRKTRTTPFHPMGNPSAERFNRTLLRMLGTLAEDHKFKWADFVPSLVQAYNATKNSSTGVSPHFLMFGWHPRLSVDAYLGTFPSNSENLSPTTYVSRLKERLQYAYRLAGDVAKKRADQNKKQYDRRVRENKLGCRRYCFGPKSQSSRATEAGR
ncbi:uncharacterized protein LOC132741766 [Ruditapes philippinarum]|uniref:uncharacterized protein LOC132741766 n=1 Tax=Ruditapes philippinarum TaxID=129788 RepID=UPI00295BC8F5|nr:uncharacterized protein LOC132741766 [Ruditapes philippinarum]